MRLRQDESGFTVTELIIALVVSTIMSGVLLMVTFHFYANAVQSQQAAELALDSQTLLSQVTDDLRLASGVSNTNLLTDPNNASGWITSDDQNILVITTPVVDASQNIVYNDETGQLYTNEIIYFLENDTIYKRTLHNDNAPGNTARTTCPAAVASASCLEDRVFSRAASDMTFTLYDAANQTIADASLARSLQIQVDFSKNVFGKDITLSNSTRIAQRNF